MSDFKAQESTPKKKSAKKNATKKKSAKKKSAKKKATKKKATKKKAKSSAQNVINFFGESLSQYPRLSGAQMSELARWSEPLASGHHDDLIFDGVAEELLGTGSAQRVRLWRSRLRMEDGMICDDLMTLEAYRNDIWEKIDEYCPRSGREANPGSVDLGTRQRGLKTRLIR